MTVHAIDHVQLSFRAGQDAVLHHFYSELVGLRRVTDTTRPSVLHYQAGPQRIDLVPTGETPSRAPHLAFSVRNLPGLRERLRAAGYAIDESRPLPGHLRFYVNDPAGNSLEFLEPVPREWA